MIERYLPADLAGIWSEENKFRAWLRVELEVCQVLAERGWIPSQSMEMIRRKANFSLARIREIENVTHHDLIAFTTSVAEHVGPDSRYIHWGLTSTDVVDTAQALQLRDVNDRILAAIDEFLEAVKRQAQEHRKTLMMGRTHGVHAEVTTFGLKLAVWYDEMRRNRERMTRAAEIMRVGKIPALWERLPISILNWKSRCAGDWVWRQPVFQPRHFSATVIQSMWRRSRSLGLRWKSSLLKSGTFSGPKCGR